MSLRAGTKPLRTGIAFSTPVQKDVLSRRSTARCAVRQPPYLLRIDLPGCRWSWWTRNIAGAASERGFWNERSPTSTIGKSPQLSWTQHRKDYPSIRNWASWPNTRLPDGFCADPRVRQLRRYFRRERDRADH